jgi:hypothetical protein
MRSVTGQSYIKYSPDQLAALYMGGPHIIEGVIEETVPGAQEDMVSKIKCSACAYL